MFFRLARPLSAFWHEDDKGLRTVMATLTLFLASNVVLFYMLVAEPYLHRLRPYGYWSDQLPHTWVWVGPGFGTFETAVQAYLSVTCLAIPLILLQNVLLVFTWGNQSKVERLLHIAFLTFSCLLWVLAITQFQHFLPVDD